MNNDIYEKVCTFDGPDTYSEECNHLIVLIFR